MNAGDVIGLVVAIILGAFFVYALIVLALLYLHIHRNLSQESSNT